jgi:hypothetical protein
MVLIPKVSKTWIATETLLPTLLPPEKYLVDPHQEDNCMLQTLRNIPRFTGRLL